MAIALNLARKWRSKNFDQVIGQDISIRMLKNSLYKNYFFPVYLFSGQKGCGKTSTARIFATAINCEQLSLFQKNPKLYSIPCLECSSCVAMAQVTHPDFIEIDAASHTGVDHVRHIVDAAGLLPVLGNKKIYLIDEAHMLSKAAFNAFLKILEEPPASVIFILATTDPEKIIDTVRSRCFQVLFKAISSADLVDHLAYICQQESLRFDKEALFLIAKETAGSVRDALNILEQARFSTTIVSKRAIQEVLGHIDNDTIITVFTHILAGDVPALFQFLHEINVQRFCPQFIWKKLLEIIRISLWMKHGVSPYFFNEYHELSTIITSCTWSDLNKMFEFLYSHERSFLKTTTGHTFLEMILLQLCQKNKKSDSGTTPISSQVAPVFIEEYSNDDQDEDVSDEQEDEDVIPDDYDMSKKRWHEFLSSVHTLEDPLLLSLFNNGICTYHEQNRFIISFPEQQQFLEDILQETKKTWFLHFKRVFGNDATVNYEFSRSEEKQTISTKRVEEKIVAEQLIPKVTQTGIEKKTATIKSYQKQHLYQQKKNVIDVSDKNKWPKANLLLKYFPGVVTECDAMRGV